MVISGSEHLGTKMQPPSTVQAETKTKRVFTRNNDVIGETDNCVNSLEINENMFCT